MVLQGNLCGKWIVIEGPDRIGKSTLIKNLSQFFIDEGNNILSNAFPRRQTIIGSILDKSLKTTENNSIINGKTQTMLFLSDMMDAYKEISECIKSGGIVITDRYTMSTYAYALAQYEEIRNDKMWIEHAISLVPKPDLFIFLKPKDMCLEFVTKRSGFGGENTEKKEIQEGVLKYMTLYSEEKPKLVETIVVDENMTPKTICDVCLTILFDNFG